MAYEKRTGTKRRYLYQSVWMNGRSRKVYHGRQTLAAMRFELMEEDRHERVAVRDQCRFWRSRYREMRAMDEESRSQNAAVEASGATELPTGIVDQELRELLARCQPARPLPGEMLTHLQKHPEKWADIGSLAERNIARMIREIAGNNEQMRLSLATMVVSQRDRLGAAAATPLQQLLIDRVIVNDMLQSYFENRLLVAEQSRQPALIRVLKEIVTSGHRQSLAAMRALDRVSRKRRVGGRRARVPMESSRSPPPPGQTLLSRLGERFEVDPERGGDAVPEGETAGGAGADASQSREQLLDVPGQVARPSGELL